MSRFAKSTIGPTRIWAPPESPLRIEFSSALLREVRMAGTVVDAFGVLYGTRQDDTVQLISTRGRTGLEPLGVFASRVRGQVFLTEDDLERYEKADACVALVISAETGGFFVRDRSGAIETINSYEEFPINSAPPAPIAKKRSPPWVYGLALIPLLYFVPTRAQTPQAVALREDSGQLRISWNHPHKANLTIIDGGQTTTIPLEKQQTMLTYADRTGDVVVKIGSAQAKFVGPPLPPGEVETMRTSLTTLRSQIAGLRATQIAGQQRIAALERSLQ